MRIDILRCKPGVDRVVADSTIVQGKRVCNGRSNRPEDYSV